MTNMNKLPFPEPKSDRTPITFEQYISLGLEDLQIVAEYVEN